MNTNIINATQIGLNVMIELKDQDGGMGPDVGALEATTAMAVSKYLGPVAVMLFNPNSIAEMARLAPHVPRGLVTDAFSSEDWSLSEATCSHLREIPDFERLGASFISHEVLKEDWWKKKSVT